MRKFVVMLFVLGFILTGAVHAAESDVKVSVAGIRIVNKGYAVEDNLKAFNWSDGISVSLLVVKPGGGIIAMDSEGSKLESFTDDKKTNLLDPGDKRFFAMISPFGSFPRVSEDSKAILIDIEGHTVPKSGTRTVTAKGTLILKTGTKTVTVDNDNVELKAGTELKAGDIKLDIEEAKVSDWDESKFSVIIHGAGDYATIKSIKFLNADGSEITASKTSTSMYGTGADSQFSWDYDLTKEEMKGTRFKIQVEMWADLKTIAVPFDLTFGIGIGE